MQGRAGSRGSIAMNKCIACWKRDAADGFMTCDSCAFDTWDTFGAELSKRKIAGQVGTISDREMVVKMLSLNPYFN